MLEKLIKIYNNKIVLNVEQFNYDKYYYFYSNSGLNNVFGIEKTISENEYQLIRSSYIEKRIYDNNGNLQSIYEYLFENKKYPFKNKKVKILVIDSLYSDFKELLLSFFAEVELIKIDNIYVAFCLESHNNELSNFIGTLSDDLGITFKLHDGMSINNKIEGNVVRNYLGIVKQFLNENEELYTDVASIVLSGESSFKKSYISIIDRCLIEPILDDSFVKDMILTYFKNDLNVSKTSKDLYVNRNSLLNKFEQIYKETGFNLQKFTHACAIYLLILYKGN